MADSASRPSRSLHGISQSSRASGSRSPSGSRPFLGLLNPMGRHYQGYSQAASLLEEDEDEHAQQTQRGSVFPSGSPRRVSWDASSQMNVLRHNEDQSSDDEVPQSLMIEASAPPKTQRPQTSSRSPRVFKPSRSSSSLLPVSHPVQVSMPPKPSDLTQPPVTEAYPVDPPKVMRGLDEYEHALWNWVNVYNLDLYLQEVYSYYEGKGIFCIALSQGLNLLTVGFVIGFSTFLLGCVDYSRIRHGREHMSRLSDVVVDRCITKFSGFTLLFFLFFGAFYIWQIVQFVFHILRLIDMYRFYTHLLGIPDADIQTISWPEIVRRLGAIRDENPVTAMSSASDSNPGFSPLTAKLDAHDVANRIMRQENYLIALFNKELLDLRSPLPRFLVRVLRTHGGGSIHGEGKGDTLTQVLEWNLRFCLMGWLFDRSGKVNRVFLKERNRKALIEQLKRRFIFMGILNAISVPFIVPYILLHSFFRYFEEYHKNPSSLSGRKYTPFAEWKFREFNELPHLFARRLAESYPTASMYIGQFPNEKVAIVMRFVAFIAGSFAAVLLLASVIDPDLFLGLEITPHRTVLFYLGVFGSVLAAARGMVPEDNRVFDPELLMTDVVHYTHYMPVEWKGKLHSQTVHKDFGQLFQMKVVIFAQELLSVVLTPFILWYSLPPCAPAIVDFFREFSVHVDGLDYVCSFAVFDFKRHGNVKYGAPTEVNEDRFMSKEGKMEKSFLNFKAANPQWNPTDPSGSLYLSRLADYGAAAHLPGAARRSGSHNRFDGTEIGMNRAQDYDRALQQSMARAASRRRAAGKPRASTRDAAKSADQTPVQSISIPAVREGDRAADGGVGSELGDSYVDEIAMRKTGKTFLPIASEHQEDGELQDAGVLGLLAQIYDQGRTAL
ncbi:APG9-domain-containing protein [Ramaria rubella]|nr:APG9-domain-containing protein [Ramaria rubella]